MTDLEILIKKVIDPGIPKISRSLREKLKRTRIVIADVGSTGFVPEIFFPIFNSCFFYTFDPDPRAVSSKYENIHNIPYGLSSEKKREKIYLTHFQPASSLYRPNEDFLKNYLNAESSNVVSEDYIELETLDSILRSDKKIDFIKIDTEGADLDILKGGDKALNECLGIKVEVQFKERNIGSPMFGELDKHLSDIGYYLLDLEIYNWLRTPNYYVNSKPEIIWGDAYYLMTKERFIELYESKEKKLDKEEVLLKYVTIISLFGAHDYGINFLSDKELEVDELQRSQLITDLLNSSQYVLIRIIKSLFLSLLMFSLWIILFPIKKISLKFKIYFLKNVYDLSRSLSYLSSEDKLTNTIRTK